MSAIKQDVAAYANEIGLDLVGVTTTEPFDRLVKELDLRSEHYQPRYAYRIETWKKFANPKELMPDAKSLLVIGYYYLAEEAIRPGTNGRTGRIVSYGHLGILKRAKLICKFLEKRGYKAMMGANRKEAAVRAGLGQIGKNNLVCNPKYGAWIAIQSIITDAEMDPDEPFTKDLCGSCRLCMDACPTGALYEPHRVDPRRCNSYRLTSRDVPEADWPNMGVRILACDACLEACPKNKGLTPRANVECLLPGDIGTQPPLRLLLGFDEDTFQTQLILFIQEKVTGRKWLSLLMRNRTLRNALRSFMKTVMKGKEKLPETFVHASGNLMIYKRNALIAAGNLGDKSMLDDVKRFVDDPYLGPYARWAAQKLEAK